MSIAGSADTLVGRGPLLDRLRPWADDARAGRGRFVLLTGEPGIGKTRMAQEILGYARDGGATAAIGRCHPDPGAPPYWPWTQVFRTLVRLGDPSALRRAVGPDLASVVEILPELRDAGVDLLPQPALDAAASRFRLLDALSRLCLEAARHRPLVVLLDDLQWADGGSLLLLELVAAGIQDAALLLVATCRTGEPGATEPADAVVGRLGRLGDVLPLGGIEPEDVAQLIARIAGHPAPADTVAALHRRTGGNPLFVHELLRLLAGTRDLRRLGVDDIAVAPLPGSIRHVIGERLGHLRCETLPVLEAAALIGKEFDIETLRAVSTVAATRLPPPANLLEALDEAIGAGLVARRGEIVGLYAFTHDLVRDTIEEALPAPRYAMLHGAIGNARAARGEAVEDVAEHFVKAAGAGFAEEAVLWATRAGERALAQWAYEAAATSFERALAALELARGEDRELRRCDLLLALGDAVARAGNAATATGILREAAAIARSAGSPERLARAALLIPQGRGEFTTSPQLFDPETAALLEEARRALGTEESGLRARVLAALSASPGQSALAAEAVALARRVGDPATLGYALHRHLLTLGPLRAPERLALAAEILDLALRVNDKLLEFEARTEQVMALIEHGDRPAIDDAVAAHARLVAELRQPGPRWTNAAVRALQAFLDGALEEAERRATEALAIGQDAQPETALQAFSGQMALIRGEQDRLDELVPAVEGLAAQQPDIPAWRCALAFMYAETGRHAEAHAELERVAVRGFSALPEDGLLHMALAQLAEACVVLGTAAHAPALYARLQPLAGRHLVVGGALCLGATDRHLAQLAALAGQTAEACRHFDAALEAQARLRAVPWLAHTRLEYAELLWRIEAPAPRVEALLEDVRAAAATYGLARVSRRLAAWESRRRTRGSSRPPGHARARLAREGEYWTVRWGDREGRLRDVKGLRYLAYLLAHPGRETHVLDLLALTEGVADAAAAVSTGSGTEALDRNAREEYRARLGDLRRLADDAACRGDIELGARVRTEMGWLEDQLAAAYGLARGSAPRDARSAAERARKAVTNRLRAAIVRLGELEPELGRHLSIALRTGMLCVYRPEHDPRWDVVP